MKRPLKNFRRIAIRLKEMADSAEASKPGAIELNRGQRDSLRALAERLPDNGVIVADEVGMGKTRIAAAVAHAVLVEGGRVAVLAPAGLGHQWRGELKAAKVDAPPVLRTISQFMQAWDNDCQRSSWFEQPAVLISHNFANWRLPGDGEHRHWALLPAVYAHWKAHTEGRWPRYSHPYRGDHPKALPVSRAAKRIVEFVSAGAERHPIKRRMHELVEKTPWPWRQDIGADSADALRAALRQVVGMGLGAFDLVVIDEAHKSRGDDSGLNRLLGDVLVQTGSARRLALTATPVELDAEQWLQTLDRIGVDRKLKNDVGAKISGYQKAVEEVRLIPTDATRLKKYKQAAKGFEAALAKYVLRRNKREDLSIQKFADHCDGNFQEYRRESEIVVQTRNLPLGWRRAVCAAEALSFVTRSSDDPNAKRLRLTIGNGHGIATLVDEVHDPEGHGSGTAMSTTDKQLLRARWWKRSLHASVSSSVRGSAIYDHPSILAAVGEIETVCSKDEKVLVFGRFNAPLRALVELLNARAMLRCIDAGGTWSQTRIAESGIAALVAAHRQMRRPGELDVQALNDLIEQRSRLTESRLQPQRQALQGWIEKGLESTGANDQVSSVLEAFRKRVGNRSDSAGADTDGPLATLMRAMQDAIGPSDAPWEPEQCARIFGDLVDAASDRDAGEQDDPAKDGEPEMMQALTLACALEDSLRAEYSGSESRFARMLEGCTPLSTRRVRQWSFNNRHGYPKVLVAQSMVGREGLNLHKACRTVVLLHPEWNPAVVEQQIGRVDRIGSLWEQMLNESIDSGDPTVYK